MWLTIHDPANTALLILLALSSKALESKVVVELTHLFLNVVLSDDERNGKQGRPLEAVNNTGDVVGRYVLGQRQRQNGRSQESVGENKLCLQP